MNKIERIQLLMDFASALDTGELRRFSDKILKPSFYNLANRFLYMREKEEEQNVQVVQD